ncbi:MAG: response regulator [Gluconobacter potus]|uniref:Response regulator n=1 Tax=Gluconobacter potus TaxID=2724927 RepID=A0ABR9YHW8_9PROT|nr:MULTISPECIES: response regulator [Gluconobacter]MBF0863798.1 response regulator [Gluconobacter sp. R71656]MBF0866605.1 response regulator [Gluconobacter sp. R75628]MBF0872267.1 response regulator [Gluconobacter sp. R75629]MBF0881233.1 response regulator [Gluconobacter potus]
MKALLVEDDAAIALVVETVLQREGWTVRHVTDGTSALEEEAPDLLVTDLNLPGARNGLEIAHLLREHRPQMAVVLMSGDYEESDMAPQGMAVLPKPFRRAGLLAAIAQVIGQVRD